VGAFQLSAECYIENALKSKSTVSTIINIPLVAVISIVSEIIEKLRQTQCKSSFHCLNPVTTFWHQPLSFWWISVVA